MNENTSKTKSKSGNRYTGVDSAGWLVKDTSGKEVGSTTYTGYIPAEAAASTYTQVTGIFAQAVRA